MTLHDLLTNRTIYNAHCAKQLRDVQDARIQSYSNKAGLIALNFTLLILILGAFTK